MSLLFDENLSPRLAERLQELYPGSVHVHQLGLGMAPDGQIWSYAKLHGLAIVTKDADFPNRSVLDPLSPKILWLHIGNCTTMQVEMLLRSHGVAIARFLATESETCLILRLRPM